MNVFGRLHGAVARYPDVADIALAVALYAATLVVTAVGPHALRGHLNAAAILGASVACGALPFRRRWPFPALAASMAGAMTFMMLSYTHGWGGWALAAPMIALYSAADVTGRRRALTVGWLAVLALAMAHGLIKPGTWFSAGNLIVIAAGGLAVAAGDASRSRKFYIAEVEERARRAERDREQDARRRVTEERLRIARDLHDIIGHQIALINVQAGVAAHLLGDQPDRALEALGHIRQASRSALDGLGATIGLMRQHDDPAAPTEPTAPIEPAAGLAALGDLVRSFSRSGLRIEHEVDGAARPVPPTAGLTAYRVIQESLTNVRKHAGDTTATVRLSYLPAGLRIVVENAGSAGPAAPGGHSAGYGIAGMRERVTAVGGNLQAGPRPDGGFRVSAVLPLPAGSAVPPLPAGSGSSGG